MGALFLVLFGGFILALLSVLFSVLAWRLKTDAMFWLGAVFTGIQALVLVINYESVYTLLFNPDMIVWSIGVVGSFFISLGLLIAAKTKPTYGSGGGVTDDYVGGSTGNSGPVTEKYLDEIINSPDEEIDFD